MGRGGLKTGKCSAGIELVSTSDQVRHRNMCTYTMVVALSHLVASLFKPCSLVIAALSRPTQLVQYVIRLLQLLPNSRPSTLSGCYSWSQDGIS